MASTSHSAGKIHFDITNIETDTFPLPSSYLKTKRDRRFFASATNGHVHRDTKLTQIDGHPLRWNETLDGLTLVPSSQLMLQVIEKHRVLPNQCLGTFVLSYETLALHSSQNTFLLSSVGPRSPSRSKTISLNILRATQSEPLPGSFKTADPDVLDSSCNIIDQFEDPRFLVPQSVAISKDSAENVIAEPRLSFDNVVEAPHGPSKTTTAQDIAAGISEAADTIVETSEKVRKMGGKPSKPSKTGVGITSQANMFTADSVNISGGSFTQNNTTSDPLDKLKHVSSAGIHALDDDGCMKGTRVSLMNDLYQWSMDVAAPPIFWLDGMAGTGKSAIARSFCRSLYETDRLGASFFCLRGHESRATAKRILPTLAWFLARRDSQFQINLLGILRDAPDVADYSIKRQVEFLLKMPLHHISVNRQQPPLVLAIDALDECADAKEVEQLLNQLLSVSKDLPVKFFLTSRPERHIVSQFASSQPEFHCTLRLHDIEQDLVEADILLYLTKQLGNIPIPNHSLSMFWPSPRDISILTRLSGKLFIYAFTAVEYIAAKNHVKRLQTLTGLTVDPGQPFHRPLDEIYSLVLLAALDPKECTSEEICMTKRILSTIVAIREPLRLSELASLLVIASDDIWENTERIRAVVNIPASGKDGVVSTFHASFVDFLTTPGRAPENTRITLSTAHHDLANCCLKTMNSSLRFNIADCKTSYLLNSEQTLATIPSPLKYASLHWAHHMDAADDSTSLLPLLENFLFEKFLFWLEVLSASGMGSRASSIITGVLASETMRQGMPENLVIFLRDAHQFAVAFREVIETSVPHIYLSALPSVHKTSKIAEVFMPKYPSLLRVTTHGIQQPRTPLLEMHGHTGSILSVAFSPDGKHVVSGSWDKTIRLWNARTGEEAMKPLRGHTSCIASVCFSPDGALVLSGSGDKTIRIWDARTGIEIMKPLEGHLDTVTSVGFSPNGAQIVSGSNDETVRIWDTRSGKEVTKPLGGHTSCVTSVCFSPDGTHIVSGSWDMRIRIWNVTTGAEVTKPNRHLNYATCVDFSPDGTHIVSGCRDFTIRILDARTGENVMEPLMRHSGYVTSVGFSPDGTHIVSGSDDKTIRVWDARTGEEVMRQLWAHTHGVSSVKFSPDGTYIVSGSIDETIRIWDARIDDVMKPLNGDKLYVTSVGFSPDGTHIVSGSEDKTIRILDARTGKEVTKLNGHTDGVTSVCFSPDGTHIVSGSEDKTIRIWDARTGKEVMKPLNGHTSNVTSACFSPDGTHIVSGSEDKTIRVWDARTGKEVTKFNGHTDGVTSVCFSPDGTHIASGSDDKTIRIWDARTGKEVVKPLNGHTSGVTSVSFSPDGTHIVSGSSDMMIQIWNSRTGMEVTTSLNGHTHEVYSVGFSPDGAHVVSGSFDKTIRIWDAKTGKEVMELNGHTSYVTSVAFSPDGNYVLSLSIDETIRIWDVRTGEEVKKPHSEHSGSQSVLRSLIPNDSSVRPNLQSSLHSDFCFVPFSHHNGWIRGSHQERIVWVLPEWRDFVPSRPCIRIIGPSRVHFDPLHFVHGLEWIRCISNS